MILKGLNNLAVPEFQPILIAGERYFSSHRRERGLCGCQLEILLLLKLINS